MITVHTHLAGANGQDRQIDVVQCLNALLNDIFSRRRFNIATRIFVAFRRYIIGDSFVARNENVTLDGDES